MSKKLIKINVDRLRNEIHSIYEEWHGKKQPWMKKKVDKHIKNVTEKEEK